MPRAFQTAPCTAVSHRKEKFPMCPHYTTQKPHAFVFPLEGVFVITPPTWPSCLVLNTASFRTRHVTVSHWRKRRNLGFPSARPCIAEELPKNFSFLVLKIGVKLCSSCSWYLLFVWISGMVQLMRSDTDNQCLKKVKLEVQDEIPPLHTHKRPKLETPPKV